MTERAASEPITRAFLAAIAIIFSSIDWEAKSRVMILTPLEIFAFGFGWTFLCGGIGYVAGRIS